MVRATKAKQVEKQVMKPVIQKVQKVMDVTDIERVEQFLDIPNTMVQAVEQGADDAAGDATEDVIGESSVVCEDDMEDAAEEDEEKDGGEEDKS